MTPTKEQAEKAAKSTSQDWHNTEHGGPFEECTARSCTMARYILAGSLQPSFPVEK